MKPHYSDDWLTVYAGDNRDVLRTLEPESVHCVVTSPPYWGLRDYGTEGQLGLESTPEQYVENMVAVFREVRRVLRNDGTLWLNLGDSYAGSGKGPSNGKSATNVGSLFRNTEQFANGQAPTEWIPVPNGLKPKDLVGIPWRVAFALQADGWYLRSDIIWAKPNPMPESVTDRPTKSHEYLFLLAKSERYYFDSDSIREDADTDKWPGIGPKHGTTDNHKSDYAPMKVRTKKPDGWDTGPGGHGTIHRDGRSKGEPVEIELRPGRNIRSVWNIATQPYPGAHFATFPPKLVEPCIKAGAPTLGVVLDPFAGSGTVGLVAQSLSRRAVLIDLNPEYIEQQLKRNAQTPLGLSA